MTHRFVNAAVKRGLVLTNSKDKDLFCLNIFSLGKTTFMGFSKSWDFSAEIIYEYQSYITAVVLSNWKIDTCAKDFEHHLGVASGVSVAVGVGEGVGEGGHGIGL